jgi:hypothetical protein
MDGLQAAEVREGVLTMCYTRGPEPTPEPDLEPPGETEDEWETWLDEGDEQYDDLSLEEIDERWGDL